MEKETRKVLQNIYAEKEYMAERVREGIEKNRKGDIKLHIAKGGKPLSGIKVKITQLTHDFHYGANIFMLDQFEKEEKNQLYRKYFAEGFNMATLPFYWDALEPEPGKLHQPDVIGMQEADQKWIDLLSAYLELLKRDYGIEYTWVFPTYDGVENMTSLLYRSDKYDLAASDYKRIYCYERALGMAGEVGRKKCK